MQRWQNARKLAVANFSFWQSAKKLVVANFSFGRVPRKLAAKSWKDAKCLVIRYSYVWLVYIDW